MEEMDKEGTVTEKENEGTVRVVNQRFETIAEYDPSGGSLIAARAVREDAAPIDNVTKFAWADEDFEDVLMYIPNPAVSVADQIAGIQRQLEQTDYRIIKCMEYSLAGLELPYDIQQLHDQRQELRDKINELEETEHGN